jgi:F-type H+-transporting ATPase subunit delta
VKDTTVAARYAHALFLVTEKRGETERALVDLRGVGVLGDPAGHNGMLLASPLVMLTDKRTVLKRVLDGKALPSVVMFADLLLRKHRFGELSVIVHEFETLVERKRGEQRATVVSAVPLTDAERTRLHRELEKRTGGTVTLATRIDPTLLGGVQVRIGDRLVDRTVKSMLEGIERQLLQTTS